MLVQQYVEIRHKDAVNWLAWLKSVRPSEAAFWSGTPQKFRNMFKLTCAALGIESLKLSPASLRAGCATWLVDGVEINRIRFLGRWSHLRSLEHYIQVARAQQITLEIPRAAAEKLRDFVSRFSFMIHLPAFLSQNVPAEHLLPVPYLTPLDPSHVITSIRSWGRGLEAIQEAHRGSRSPERGEIPRSLLERPQKSSQVLQARSSLQPVRKENDERASFRNSFQRRRQAE